MMPVYELIKDIDTPHFSHTLKANDGHYSLQLIKQMFGNGIERNKRFADFFKVSETHEMRNCRLVEKKEVVEGGILSTISRYVMNEKARGKRPATIVIHQEDANYLSENATYLFSIGYGLYLSDKGRINIIKVLGLNLSVIEAVNGIKKGDVCVF